MACQNHPAQSRPAGRMACERARFLSGPHRSAQDTRTWQAVLCRRSGRERGPEDKRRDAVDRQVSARAVCVHSTDQLLQNSYKTSYKLKLWKKVVEGGIKTMQVDPDCGMVATGSRFLDDNAFRTKVAVTPQPGTRRKKR